MQQVIPSDWGTTSLYVWGCLVLGLVLSLGLIVWSGILLQRKEREARRAEVQASTEPILH